MSECNFACKRPGCGHLHPSAARPTKGYQAAQLCDQCKCDLSVAPPAVTVVPTVDRKGMFDMISKEEQVIRNHINGLRGAVLGCERKADEAATNLAVARGALIAAQDTLDACGFNTDGTRKAAQA